MRTPTVLALRVVLAIALAGAVAVQVVLVPLFWADLDAARPWIRTSVVVVVLLAVLALEVAGVSVWRLVTMARHGTVFSLGAFRHVDRVMGALAALSVLVLSVAVVAATANRTAPGDEVAPGVVALVCGAALVVAGVALVVLVLRALLVQAVQLDATAQHLQAELDQVV